MELHQVRYFLSVCETRNFTRAAERCNVSQPALTTGIKKLEQELEGPLFHRERGGIKLTTLGEMLRPRFMRLAAESDSINSIADNYRLLRNVPLRVGVLTTVGPARIAALLESFRARAPAVELELQIEQAKVLLERLQDAQLDLAITNVCEAPPGWLVMKPLYKEAYLVALPPGHQLLQKKEIELRDLNQETYIDRLACELRDMINDACTVRNVELYAAYRTDREAWIECLVRAGVGFAFLPAHSFVSVDTGRRPLIEPNVLRTVSIVRSSEREMSPAARILWETFLEQGQA